jgi:hypothetical protein
MNSSILRLIWLNFMAQYLVFSALLQFLQFFGIPTFRPEYHWRDLISRNAHLVHQNWYRISFIFKTWLIWKSFNFSCNNLYYWLKISMEFLIHRSMAQYSIITEFSNVTEYIVHKQIIRNIMFYSTISMFWHN